MVKGIAILSTMIMIGTNSFAKDCFYSQETQYSDGQTVNSITRYDCQSPPQVVIVEKEIPAKNRSVGEFLFGVEENGNGITHLFNTLVSVGVF